MDDKNKNITVVILAGGKSSRMGQDKGILKLNGKPMIRHIIEAASGISDKLLIIANNDNYRDFGLPVYPDLIQGCGPLGGIYTGLCRSLTARNLFLSCDIPLVSRAFLKFFTGKSTYHEDVMAPFHNSKLEPLCAVYHKRILKEVLNQILETDYKLHHLFQKLHVKTVNIEQEFPASVFSNINTTIEFNKLKNVKI